MGDLGRQAVVVAEDQERLTRLHLLLRRKSEVILGGRLKEMRKIVLSRLCDSRFVSELFSWPLHHASCDIMHVGVRMDRSMDFDMGEPCVARTDD